MSNLSFNLFFVNLPINYFTYSGRHIKKRYNSHLSKANLQLQQTEAEAKAKAQTEENTSYSETLTMFFKDKNLKPVFLIIMYT